MEGAAGDALGKRGRGVGRRGGRTGGKERARDREGRHRPGQPAIRGAGGGRSLPAQVRGARGHARVERRQEEGEGGRGHPESEEGGRGRPSGGEAAEGPTPRALAVPALPRLFSRPFTRSVFPASPGSGSQISGGLGGGRRERGDRVSEAVLGRGTTCWEAPQPERLCAPGYLRLAAGCSVVSINVHPVLHHLRAHWMGLFSEVRAQVVHLAASSGGCKWVYVN